MAVREVLVLDVVLLLQLWNEVFEIDIALLLCSILQSFDLFLLEKL